MPRKLKKSGQYIKKLERIFNAYIRNRDTNDQGWGACISCNRVFPFAELDAGHYWSVKNSPIRFDERNVNAQCQGCNRFREGNKPAYTINLIKKYGAGILEELDELRQKVTRWSIPELREKIKEYEQKVLY